MPMVLLDRLVLGLAYSEMSSLEGYLEFSQDHTWNLVGIILKLHVE